MGKNKLTHERLLELLDYDAESGVFVWKVDRGQCVKIGDRAGCLYPTGYRVVRIDREKYLEHRLAHFHVRGYMTENVIHHIDHVKVNNRISNLTETSQFCNSQSRNDNTSGQSGVSWNKTHQKWQVQHYDQKTGKRKFLGYYKNYENACMHKFAAIEEDKQPTCNLGGVHGT